MSAEVAGHDNPWVAEGMAQLSDVSWAVIVFKRIQATDAADYILRRSLFESGVMAIRRALRNGQPLRPDERKTNTGLLSLSDAKSVVSDSDLMEEILGYADKTVAHRNVQTRSFVASNDDEGSPKVDLFVDISFENVQGYIVLCEQLRDHLIEVTGKAMTSEEE